MSGPQTPPPAHPGPWRGVHMYSSPGHPPPLPARSSSSSSQPFRVQDAPPSPMGQPAEIPLPEPNRASSWPGFAEDDESDSDDSVDGRGEVKLISPKSLKAASSWFTRQAPVFFCGALVAWISLLVLWRSDHEALEAEVKSARLLLAELRHMSEVVRAEVIEAHKILGAVGDHKAKKDISSMSVQSPLASTIGKLPEVDLLAGVRANAKEVPSILDYWVTTVLLSLGLFVLDNVVAYFCLRQCAPHGLKLQIEDFFLRLLDTSGFGSVFRAPGERSTKYERHEQSSRAAALQQGWEDDSSPSPAKQVEPVAADALLVRKRDGRELAPVHKMNAQQQAASLREFRQRRSSIALGAASFFSVASTRLGASAAGFLGWRFMSHLIMYAALTVRVCLIAFLVLF